MLSQLTKLCQRYNAKLIAVSKTKPVSQIKELYNHGQRHFGENRVQELVEKQELMPKDICWHLIGHLQKNKVKYIAPFIHLIHSVDSQSLLKTINKEALKNERTIPVLLQIKIAKEDSKFGLSIFEAEDIIKEIKNGLYPAISLKGLMGMATFTDNKEQISAEFSILKQLKSDWSNKYNLKLDELSMGMSGDYQIALNNGSTMIRVGSLLFGKR